MPSRASALDTTYLKNGRARYSVTVTNSYLNKVQDIRGPDEYIVRQKARAKAAQWDEAEQKKLAAEDRKLRRELQAQDREEKKQLAAEQTAEARAAVSELGELLVHTLAVDDSIDWSSLRDTEPYGIPEPQLQLPDAPPAEPKATASKYRVSLTFFDRIFAGRRRRKEEEQRARFEEDHGAWKRMVETYEKGVLEANRRHSAALREWGRARDDFLGRQQRTNAAIEEKERGFLERDPEAFVDAMELVLGASQYPDGFPQVFELVLAGDGDLLVVEYRLPAPEDMPSTKEVRYVQSRDEFDLKTLPESQRNKLYDSVIAQVALRTIHEIYESDTVEMLRSVVFNGMVETIDAATGQDIRACILSVQADRSEFLGIHLANVDPKACLKKLKGVCAARLHTTTPIAPIYRIEREDDRFVEGREVLDGVPGEQNLAAMNWEDFEHLIREIFEKEFSTAGGEVKVTQASRDGGIDAVVFDPDPIRGGKIVIQAKRYTNTVGVAAVRDLYGTVLNEGANKGILVSTSNYGSDAYAFARDKPLTLLDGANLLHLLGKHGHPARIDLKEAKEILKDQSPS